MLARYLFLAIIALGSLAAAAKLVPGDLERLAMLERDGRHEQAMEELQKLYKGGQRAPELMLRLYNLKIRFGEVDEAQTVLEEYARRRPSDIEAQIGLIRFYHMNQLESHYVRALRDLQERTRSRELLAELLGFFRMTGRYREEEELLENTARANRAGPAEFERLGLLAAARNDLPRAAVALRRADGRLDVPSRAARIGLFRVLLELKEADEAHQRCLVWLRNWRDPELAAELMDAFSQAGRADLALDVGGRFGGPGSDLTLQTAEILGEQGKHVEALQRLREYQSVGLPEDPERAQRFVSISAASGDPEMALRAARLVGLRKLEGGVILDLLDSIEDALENRERQFPKDLLKGLSTEIDVRLQNVTPLAQEAADRLVLADDARLFVTQLAMIDNDIDMARKYLASIDPDRLSAFDLSRWTEMQVAAGLRSSVFPNLPRNWRRRDRADPLAGRLQRIERTKAAEQPAARAKTTEPGGNAAGAPVAAGAREVSSSQASQAETAAAKARRTRRRAAALERRRESVRQANSRREQQNAPSPKATAPSTPLQPQPFLMPGQIGGG